MRNNHLDTYYCFLHVNTAVYMYTYLVLVRALVKNIVELHTIINFFARFNISHVNPLGKKILACRFLSCDNFIYSKQKNLGRGGSLYLLNKDVENLQHIWIPDPHGFGMPLYSQNQVFTGAF